MGPIFGRGGLWPLIERKIGPHLQLASSSSSEKKAAFSFVRVMHGHYIVLCETWEFAMYTSAIPPVAWHNHSPPPKYNRRFHIKPQVALPQRMQLEPDLQFPAHGRPSETEEAQEGVRGGERRRRRACVVQKTGKLICCVNGATKNYQNPQMDQKTSHMASPRTT